MSLYETAYDLNTRRRSSLRSSSSRCSGGTRD